MDYYFTYGTADFYPFRGGWTRVTASSKREAIRIFREAHPDRIPHVLNCCDYYTKNSMGEMLEEGNLGAFEHEHLTE